jgi:hypothetical protein
VKQLDSLISFINRNYDALFLIQALAIFLLFTLLIFLWNITRKRYRNLRGEIPADALNSYLDSLKQNTNAVNSNSMPKVVPETTTAAPNPTPSVMPLDQMQASGQSVAVTSGISSEELNEKNAEISQLRALLQNKGSQIADLENKLVEASMSGGAAGATDEVAQAAVQNLQKEKAELEEKLKVYEVIDDDIAELSKLRKENEELKKSIGQTDYPAPEPVVEEPTAPVVEEPTAPVMEEPAAPVMEEPVAPVMEEPVVPDMEEMLGAMEEETVPEPAVDEAAIAPTGDDMDALLGGGPDSAPPMGGDDMDALLGGGDDIPVMDQPPAVVEEAPIEEPDAQEDGKSVEVKETDTPDDLLSQFEELLG